MDDLITPHNFVDDCDCHQCSLRARDQLRTEVDRLRNIEAAAVMCIEHPVWNDDQFYDLMRGLEDSLRGEVGAGETVKPVAWVRFCSDGCYEGPIMDEQIEDVRKNSGAWTPLYARHNG